MMTKSDEYRKSSVVSASGQHLIALLLIAVFSIGTPVNAHYSIKVALSDDVVNEGDQVTVTCDVTNYRNASFTLVWVKRVGLDEVNIGSNSHLEDAYRQTGRYRLSYDVIKQLTNVKFTLTITGVTSADAGEIGCRIPIHGIELLKNLTVLVPVQSVQLLSRDVDDSHVHSYANGRQVEFVDGEIRRIMCRVNGSYPAPAVRMFVGDSDVTSLFTNTTTSFRVGPSVPRGPVMVYYSSELNNPSMRIGFEFSGKSLRCVANVPGSNFTDVSTSITIAFAAYKPKFVNCVGPVVSVPRYNSNVRLTCEVQAQPAVKDVWVRWKRGEASSVSLTQGQRDGHYFVELNPLSDMLRSMALRMDTVYPQHFRNYTFIAQNSEGTSEYSIQLTEAVGAKLTSDVSRCQYSSSILAAFTASTLLALSAILCEL